MRDACGAAGPLYPPHAVGRVFVFFFRQKEGQELTPLPPRAGDAQTFKAPPGRLTRIKRLLEPLEEPSSASEADPSEAARSPPARPPQPATATAATSADPGLDQRQLRVSARGLERLGARGGSGDLPC